MDATTPPLIDTHCHLSSAAFGPDKAEALARAREAGVGLVLDVGTEPEDWGASLALAAAEPGVRCILGLHPNSAGLWDDAVRDRLCALLERSEVVAVGETGMDFYRLGASKELQERVFVEHLALAREAGKPVVIHARDAYDEILDVIARMGGGTRGVMHSFMGSVEQAERALSLGYAISISGPVTYKSGQAVRDVAAAVPLDRLLVETDSPYLPPHPHRGKRNEPAYVALTAAQVAEVRGIAVEELAAATTENARWVFGL